MHCRHAQGLPDPTVAEILELIGRDIACVPSGDCSWLWADLTDMRKDTVTLDEGRQARNLTGCQPSCETVSSRCRPMLDSPTPDASQCDKDRNGKVEGNDLIYWADEAEVCDERFTCGTSESESIEAPGPLDDTEKKQVVCDFFSQCLGISLPAGNRLGCGEMGPMAERLMARVISPDELEEMLACSGCGGDDGYGPDAPNKDPGDIGPPFWRCLALGRQPLGRNLQRQSQPGSSQHRRRWNS